MLSERDYMQRPRRGWNLSATVVLIALNVVVFVLQRTLLRNFNVDDYLALSLSGLEHGYVWQLLTFQFLHGSLLHIFLNCWALFVFGRPVEWAIGKSRFLVLYFSSGVFGGLLQMVAMWLWPIYFGAPTLATLGASAGVFGVVAAFAMLFPNERLLMLLFFVLPVNMRAKSLLWLVIIVSALGMSFPHSRLTLLLGGNVAHAAHFGGILTGLAFTRFYLLKVLRLPEPAG